MHLLNEVLPAATSCASPADAASDDAMATSALSVSLFMCALHGFGGGSVAVVARGARKGQARQNASGLHRFSHFPESWRSRPAQPWATTQSGPDVLDSA